MLVAIDRRVRRSAAPFLRLALAACVAMSVAGTHSVLAGTDHMAGAMTEHAGHVSPSAPASGLEEALAMCLAVAESSALALAAGILLAGAMLLRGRGVTCRLRDHLVPLAIVPPVEPRSRAGPETLALLQVLRT